jgi:hypothetical protein
MTRKEYRARALGRVPSLAWVVHKFRLAGHRRDTIACWLRIVELQAFAEPKRTYAAHSRELVRELHAAASR